MINSCSCLLFRFLKISLGNLQGLNGNLKLDMKCNVQLCPSNTETKYNVYPAEFINNLSREVLRPSVKTDLFSLITMENLVS